VCVSGPKTTQPNPFFGWGGGVGGGGGVVWELVTYWVPESYFTPTINFCTRRGRRFVLVSFFLVFRLLFYIPGAWRKPLRFSFSLFVSRLPLRLRYHLFDPFQPPQPRSKPWKREPSTRFVRQFLLCFLRRFRWRPLRKISTHLPPSVCVLPLLQLVQQPRFIFHSCCSLIQVATGPT